MLPSSEAVIGPGSEVVMHFSITLEDGTLVDTTREENQPIEFVMGDGTFIEGLELALYGLKQGEKQVLKIGPENTYGFPDDENIYKMERSAFSADMKLAPGVIIGFDTPSGEELPGTVLKVEDDKVEVDFNHPLSGHEISFEVDILEIK